MSSHHKRSLADLIEDNKENLIDDSSSTKKTKLEESSVAESVKKDEKKREKTPPLDGNDMETDKPKVKILIDGTLPPALDRRPSKAVTLIQKRNRVPGLCKVPSRALKYNGLIVDDDNPKNDEEKDIVDNINNINTSKLEKENESDSEEEVDSRQALISELKEQLVPCSRKLIEKRLINYVLWFDEDDDHNECLWVAKLVNHEFDESHDASNLLVTWPGYGDGTTQYWIPAIFNERWHAYQLSTTVLHDKYKNLIYEENLKACIDILKDAKENVEELTDSEEENHENDDDDIGNDSPSYGESSKNKRKKKKKTKSKKTQRVMKKKKNAENKAKTKKPIKEKKTTSLRKKTTITTKIDIKDTNIIDNVNLSDALVTKKITDGKDDSTMFNGQDTTRISKIIPVSGRSLVGLPDEKCDEEAIEIVFSFDTTGSMYSCLESVRTHLRDLITRLFKDIPKLRIGVIAHGDYCDEKNSYCMRWVDLTSNVDRLTKFVMEVEKTGGGDSPECYELVLHNICREFSWNAQCRNRSLVLIGDENPHEKNSNNPFKLEWREKAKDCKACGIKIYGIHCLGHTASKEFYHTIADMTGGIYLTLDKINSFGGMMVAICHREQDLSKQNKQYKPSFKDDENYKNEKQKYKETCESLELLSVEELKEKLRKNDQKISGTKNELIERIADGILYGGIPKCVQCGGGRLRVIYENGKKYGHSGKGRYYCPGFHEDDEFKLCTWTGDQTQIKRELWIN